MQHRNLISILRKVCKFLLEFYDGDSYKSPLPVIGFSTQNYF